MLESAIQLISKIYSKELFKIKYILVISIIIIIVSNLFSSNDIENIRSLLSTIIASLASILAIVISLTLVAVQLSSQNYSPRILKMFIREKNTDFWSTILIYFISIIFGLFLLNSISKVNDNGNVTWLTTIGVIIIILLTFWSLLLLPRYISSTLDRLAPEKIIKELADRIDRNYIQEFERCDQSLVTNSFKNPNKMPADHDPIIPLIDITIGAIKNGHTDTAEEGLCELGDQIVPLIEKDIINKGNGRSFLNYLLDNHFERVTKVAIDNSDSKSLYLIVKIVDSIANKIAEKDSHSYQLLLSFFGSLSKNILKIEFESVIRIYLRSLGELITDTIINLIKYPSDPFLNSRILTASVQLNNILVESIKKPELNIIYEVNIKFKDFLSKIAIHGFKNIIYREINFLRGFGIYLVNNNPEMSYIAIDHFTPLFKDFYREGFKKLVGRNLNNEDIQKELDYLVIEIILALKSIGTDSIESNNYRIITGPYVEGDTYGIPIIKKIILSLGDILIDYLDKEDNRRTICDNTKYADNIVSGGLSHLSEMGFKLVNKESNLVIDVLSTICKISVGDNQSRFAPEERITIKGLEILGEFGDKLINKEMIESISELTNDIIKIGEYGIKINSFRIAKKSIHSLEIILKKLIEHKDLQNNFKEAIEHSEKILSIAIENEDPKYLQYYLKVIKFILLKIKRQGYGMGNTEWLIIFLNNILIKIGEDRRSKSIISMKKWFEDYKNEL